MLVGNAGVGKTVFVRDRLAALSDDYVVSNIPFNYYTTSAVLQSKFYISVQMEQIWVIMPLPLVTDLN